MNKLRVTGWIVKRIVAGESGTGFSLIYYLSSLSPLTAHIVWHINQRAVEVKPSLPVAFDLVWMLVGMNKIAVLRIHS